MWPLSISENLVPACYWSPSAPQFSACRLLQALAVEKILTFLAPLAHREGVEPRKGMVPSFMITFAFVMVASLDTISPILAMFYLIDCASHFC